jgi:hypothetical protein
VRRGGLRPAGGPAPPAHHAPGQIGYTTEAKFSRGVRGADSERVVLLYLLRKP